MTTYSDYRQGFEKVIEKEIRTELSVFTAWIAKVFTPEVKELVAQQEAVAKVAEMYKALGHEEFFDCFMKASQAEKALETGKINSIVLSEIEYRLSK